MIFLSVCHSLWKSQACQINTMYIKKESWTFVPSRDHFDICGGGQVAQLIKNIIAHINNGLKRYHNYQYRMYG
jgi:hypothetical protein